MSYDPSKPYKKELIKKIQATWETPYVSVTSGVYPIIKKKFNKREVQHTDGIGTKGHYHWIAKTFKSATQDALAMNLNDFAVVGAVPYALQDHIVTPDPGEESVLAIMSALASECKRRKIAITGGETSHHNNADGIDISITVSGFIQKVRKNELRPGDTLIGLASSGIHSNGFTKVRAMFGSGEWRDEFVEPTTIYHEQILKVLTKHKMHGMVHVTGGAFTRLKDYLIGGDAHIAHPPTMRPQSIFQELNDRGVSSKDMYATFNCGIGFILSVPESETKGVLRMLKGAAVVGSVGKGTGQVHITSAFDGKSITF